LLNFLSISPSILRKKISISVVYLETAVVLYGTGLNQRAFQKLIKGLFYAAFPETMQAHFKVGDFLAVAQF